VASYTLARFRRPRTPSDPRGKRSPFAVSVSSYYTEPYGRHKSWPPLPLPEWQDTYRTLHMWMHSVGNIRMAMTSPLKNWHVTLIAL